MSWDEHKINLAYESMLDQAWEDYNREGDLDETDYDPYAEAEAMWEAQNER